MSKRILVICNKPPYPSVDGGALAMGSSLKCLLKSDAQVKLLCISTDKHPFKPELFPENIRSQTNPSDYFLDTQLKPVPALMSLLKGSSYNIERFDNPGLHQHIADLLSVEEYDFIWLESLFCTPYLPTIRKHSSAKVVMRAHNVEYKIWERIKDNSSNPIKKFYLNRLVKSLRKYEIDTLPQLDGIVAISEIDEKQFRADGFSGNLTTVPCGFDLHELNDSHPHSEKTPLFFHIGAMDWQPNIEAVDRLVKQIWPAISSTSEAELHLAGKNMNTSDFQSIKGVIAHGQVPDAHQFIEDKDILIVPLSSGSGIRIKVLEAMAMGKVVISSNVGMEGIQAKSDQHFLLANSDAEFQKQILNCLKNPDICIKIGREARSFVLKNYDNARLSSLVSDFLNRC